MATSSEDNGESASCRRSSAVAAMSGHLASGTGIADIVDRIAEIVVENTDVEYAQVWEYSTEKNIFILRGGMGVGESLLETIIDSYDAECTQVGYSFREECDVITHDWRYEDRFSADRSIHGKRIFGSVSILICGVLRGHPNSYGVLCVHSRNEIKLTTDDLNFLHTAASILGAAYSYHEIDRKLVMFRTAFDSSAEGIEIADKNGRSIYHNKAYDSLFGYSVEELNDKGGARLLFIDPEDARSMFETLLDGRSWNREIKMRSRDQQIKTVSIRADRINDRNGNIVGLIGLFKDVTKRRKTEEQMRLLGSAMVNTGDAVLIAEIISESPLECKTVYVNRAFTRVTGYLPEDVLAQSPDSYCKSRRDNNFAERLFDSFEQGEPVQFEFEGRRKDGSTYWTEAHYVPVRDEKGKITHITSIRRDLTARRFAEERIREQAALLDQAHDAIFVLNMNDRIIYWNKGAESLLGWNTEEVMGCKIIGMMFDEDNPSVAEALNHVREEGTWQSEMIQRTKDDSRITVDSSWTLVNDEDGNPRAIMVVNADITEKKRLASDLVRSAQLAMVGELAAGFAHEIKNPLAGIQYTVELMSENRDEDDPEREYLQDVVRAVERIDTTVKDLLNMARPGRQKFASGNISDVVANAVRITRAHLAVTQRSRKVSLEFQNGYHDLIAMMDSSQIEGIIINLIINANEAITNDGRISVRVYSTGDEEAVIEVEDTGHGIPPGNMSRIFNSFFTTKSHGTGLGLATAKLIADIHSGRIEVSSQMECGSVFKLFLPLQKELDLTQSHRDTEAQSII